MKKKPHTRLQALPPIGWLDGEDTRDPEEGRATRWKEPGTLSNLGEPSRASRSRISVTAKPGDAVLSRWHAGAAVMGVSPSSGVRIPDPPNNRNVRAQPLLKPHLDLGPPTALAGSCASPTLAGSP